VFESVHWGSVAAAVSQWWEVGVTRMREGNGEPRTFVAMRQMARAPGPMPQFVAALRPFRLPTEYTSASTPIESNHIDTDGALAIGWSLRACQRMIHECNRGSFREALDGVVLAR